MSDSTKLRILDAASALLKSRGPEGTTVEAAAELAGVSRKTVYNHFTNRFQLIDEATSLWIESTIATLEDIVVDEDKSFIDRLNVIVERGFAELRAGGRILGEPVGPVEPPGFSGPRKSLRDKLREFIQGLVHQAIETGLVRTDFEERRLTWVIINMIEGLMFIDGLEDEPFARVDILRDSLRAVLVGILTEKGSMALKDSLIFTEKDR